MIQKNENVEAVKTTELLRKKKVSRKVQIVTGPK